jgi:hypothetical protein
LHSCSWCNQWVFSFSYHSTRCPLHSLHSPSKSNNPNLQVHCPSDSFSNSIILCLSQMHTVTACFKFCVLLLPLIVAHHTILLSNAILKSHFPVTPHSSAPFICFHATLTSSLIIGLIAILLSDKWTLPYLSEQAGQCLCPPSVGSCGHAGLTFTFNEFGVNDPKLHEEFSID